MIRMQDPMKDAQRYLDIVASQIRQVRESQWSSIQTAGQWIAEAYAEDHWFYTFGTGHSRLLAEEVFHRAGGLARAVPLLDPMVYFTAGAEAATAFERKEGAAQELLGQYPAEAGDVIMVASNSGRNALPIEMALHAKEKGMKVIALVNLEHSKAWPTRHSSGENLTEVADLVLDNCGIEGDAALEIEGVPGRLAPTSTITGALLVNLVLVAAVSHMKSKGIDPEIYISSNSNGDDHNTRLADKYRHRIRHL